MTVNKLSLYNGALLLVGEGFTTLTENREPRRLLDQIWDKDAIKACLEAGQWLFATRTVVLEPDYDDLDFGYQYGYDKPTDWVRTCAISADEYFNDALTAYRDEAGVIYTDANPLYLSYVSDDADYGRDYSKWPLSFVNYVEAYLAKGIVPRIQNSITTTDKLEKDMKKLLSNAQGKNAVNRPTTFYSKGSFVRARRGSFGTRRDGEG